jgi:hypothetical protein
MKSSSAKIIAYPADCRVGEIRHVVARLAALRGRARSTFVRGVVDALAAEFQALGFGDAETNLQLAAFQMEVYRLWHSEHFSRQSGFR